jgi:hypothetical protein
MINANIDNGRLHEYNAHGDRGAADERVTATFGSCRNRIGCINGSWRESRASAHMVEIERNSRGRGMRSQWGILRLDSGVEWCIRISRFLTLGPKKPFGFNARNDLMWNECESPVSREIGAPESFWQKCICLQVFPQGKQESLFSLFDWEISKVLILETAESETYISHLIQAVSDFLEFVTLNTGLCKEYSNSTRILHVLLDRLSGDFSQYFPRNVRISEYPWTHRRLSPIFRDPLHGLNLIHCSLAFPTLEENRRHRRIFASVAQNCRTDYVAYGIFPADMTTDSTQQANSRSPSPMFFVFCLISQADRPVLAMRLEICFDVLHLCSATKSTC